jgi:GDP/UDP-N,N'-diacetylbacillosamine 2-epimerase (hydrolysing)
VRKICVISGTRAEYGLLRPLIELIRDSQALRLQLVVTGMHLSPEFGLTYREIEEDGFVIDRKIDMLLSSDDASGIAKSMGLGLIGFADALRELRPDVVLVLGDRFEILPGVVAAMIAGIPVAHVHGGESTEGAFDEAIRHAITKMSHLHFVAAEAYRQRVVQLGEHPERVFLTGGLGVDSIARLTLLGREALERELGFRFAVKNLLITFHPVTLEAGSGEAQMGELLAALDALGASHEGEQTRLIFTMPNADTDGRKLMAMVQHFVDGHPNACVFSSLGQLRYLSCMALVDGVVGNSSSGLTEAPSLRVGTVNIGDRQRGRLQAASVIDCAPERSAIGAALTRLFSPQFKTLLARTGNPYGEVGACSKIAEVLATYPLDGLLKKQFYDLSLS